MKRIKLLLLSSSFFVLSLLIPLSVDAASNYPNTVQAAPLGQSLSAPSGQANDNGSLPVDDRTFVTGLSGTQDFVVTSFDADETLDRSDPQGTLRIIERINVDFRDYNHGILRAIPKTYKGHSLQLHINSISST